MIEKTENPLNLGLEQIDPAIDELQKTFDTFAGDLGSFTINETFVALHITTSTGEYSYDLAQLKKLKAEIEDPLLQSLGEMT